MMLFVGAPLQKTAMICVSDLKAGLSNRVVGANNPVNFVDPSGLLQRDSNGELIYEEIGYDISRYKSTGDEWYSLEVYLFTDTPDENGKPVKIRASLNRTKTKKYDTDCHGLTFTAGEYWINNDQVEKILKYDEYSKVPVGEFPVPGDIAVYRNERGEVVHSGTVVVGGRWPRVLETAGLQDYDPTIGPAWLSSGSKGTVTYYFRGGL